MQIFGDIGRKTAIKLGFLCLFLLFYTTILVAQTIGIGTPPIQQYTPNDYHAGIQNWGIEIAPNGTVLCANHDGLLTFDGERWSLYEQPSKSTGRSLNMCENGRILFGGQDELGYFDLFSKKQSYQSFMDQVPEENRDLEDIWHIKNLDEVIVFRSRYHINMLIDDKFKSIESGISSNFLALIDSTFYYNDYFRGIYELDKNGRKSFISGSELFKEVAIIDMVRLNKDVLLVLTENKSIYKYEGGVFSQWDISADPFLRKQQIVSCLKLHNNDIAIGTRLGGLIVLAQSGQTRYKVDKKAGLQNNSITGIAQDAWGDVWLATYHGIDKVHLSSSLSRFYPDGELQSTIYDIELWEGQWWFGTSNGLYTLPHKAYYDPLAEWSFRYIEGSKGQVWSLDLVGDELFLGHNHGAYKVLPSGFLQKMDVQSGTWAFVELPNQKMAIGTYDGVTIFRKRGNEWVSDFSIEGFNESARIMVKGTGNNLWVSHAYRGIYRFSFDKQYADYEVKKYEASSGFLNKNNNYISSLFDKPTITNESGIYQYDSQNDTFVKDSLINALFADCGKVRRLFQKGNYIWYISDTETGIIRIINEGLKLKYQKQVFPELTNIFVSEFENLYFRNDSTQLLSTNKGVLYHQPSPIDHRPGLEGYVSYIQLDKMDSIITPNNQLIKLTYQQNALTFNFRTNGKSNAELIGYSHKLDGLDSEWSPYGPISFKEYNKLDPGKYVFMLKAKAKNGLESEVSMAQIEIQPPWYLSLYAYIGYFLLISLVITGLLLIPQKKYKKETAILVDKQQQVEKEIVQIKREQLQSEINVKNQELASSTLHLLQKNQTLLTLKEKIDELNKKAKNPELRKELQNLKSILHTDLRLDEDWDRFSMHFDQVHHDFFKKLKTTYPNLTKNDHQLCAYLKMGLSTKEMVPLLNISVRGVEISRYRLRKKINIDRSVNLNQFFNTEFE